MSIISLIVVLMLVGILVYVIEVYVPMDAGIKKLLRVAVIVFLIVWLLQAFGFLEFLTRVRIGK